LDGAVYFCPGASERKAKNLSLNPQCILSAHLTSPEGNWFGLGDTIRRGEVLVFRVAPSTAFGFGKGTRSSQTRWSFA
jgi:hypothetical protein